MTEFSCFSHDLSPLKCERKTKGGHKVKCLCYGDIGEDSIFRKWGSNTEINLEDSYENELHKKYKKKNSDKDVYKKKTS